MEEETHRWSLVRVVVPTALSERRVTNKRGANEEVLLTAIMLRTGARTVAGNTGLPFASLVRSNCKPRKKQHAPRALVDHFADDERRILIERLLQSEL